MEVAAVGGIPLFFKRLRSFVTVWGFKGFGGDDQLDYDPCLDSLHFDVGHLETVWPELGLKNANKFS